MRRETSFGIFTMLALAVLIAGASLTAWAVGPPPKDELQVVAHNSTGGVPAVDNAAPVEWFFDYNVSAGSSINDSIPVDLTLVDNDGDADCATVALAVSGNAPPIQSATTVAPSPVTVCNGTTQSSTITISTGPLAAGDYAANVQVGFDPENQAANFKPISHNTIHIHVHVAEGSAISCFVTDSGFNFLNDCGGNAISSGDGGRFTIVTNKKNIEVATNPGQFYYNVLWTNNTGSDVTVSVHFDRTGVHAHGTQAIHASLFPAFPDLSAANFQQVNDDIPSGADDNLENITVPAGYTLWVDYHLEWNGLGSPAPSNIATSCATANQPFHVTATITNLGSSTTIGTCTAGAIGYKK
ncbi:MAG TPA: hypothetical protein VNK82_09130 [Terriglobales bacterium]|nr:hypothetical protein [Terriglobales bacterium]